MTGTIKAIGYPCRDTFAVWLDELHHEVRHHVVGKATGVQHSPELKQAAVIELCTRQTSAGAFRRDLWQLQLGHDLLKKANELLKKAWASTCHS
jgi:putative transposase